MLIPFDEENGGHVVWVNHLYVTHVKGLRGYDGSMIYIVGMKEPIKVEESACDAAGLLDLDSDEEDGSV